MFSKGYPQDKQISYTGMLWLLGAQLVVMAPLVFYLPVWLLPIVFFSAGWRIRVMKGYQAQPGKITKIIIAILGFIALAFSGMQTVSLDMMASLLMLGFAYKALEVIERRDAMVVILTGFLLIGVLFLYSQSMLTALYGVFALIVLTGAMIAIQQSKSYPIISNIKLAFAMLILCLPLMLLFFLVSPRFAPLWSVPIQAGHAKTGISDSMSPGDIAELSKSDELAFTVTFKGERPQQKVLYWRGLVLQNFDGKTWTQFSEKLNAEESRKKLEINKQQLQEKLYQNEDIKEGIREYKEYEAIYEKTAQPWLFTLSPVVNIKGDAIYGSDFRVMAKQNIFSPMMLKLTSYPNALREVYLPEATRKSALQLPKSSNSQNTNPKSVALAKRLLAESSSKQEYINKVMNRYRQQEYYYTLRPKPLGNTNTIDEFLINSKKGFCAHYAGSFVFLMRAAGIPARIVTGYQGGTWNDKGNFLSIRQYDAHAWTEVWLENKGWIRFDPTQMVAPSRIEKNLEEAMAEEGSFLEGKLFSLSKYSWLNSLQNKLDSTQYAWRKFVLGYDNETQASFLKSIFGELSMQKMATIVGGFFLGIIVFWSLFLGLGRKRSTEAVEHQLYRRFCSLLNKYGVKREPSQTPSEFSKTASTHLPKASSEINAFSKLYSDLCYNPDAQSKRKEHIARLRQLLKQVKTSVN